MRCFWLLADGAPEGAERVTISARGRATRVGDHHRRERAFPRLDRTFACVQTACLSQMAARWLHERALRRPLRSPLLGQSGSTKPDFAGAPSYARWAPTAPLLPEEENTRETAADLEATRVDVLVRQSVARKMEIGPRRSAANRDPLAAPTAAPVATWSATITAALPSRCARGGHKPTRRVQLERARAQILIRPPDRLMPARGRARRTPGTR
jgi:hypothetical protein